MEKIKNAILILLFITSLAIFAIWGLNLSGGAFPDGVFVGSQETSLLIFHLVAEFLMATITLIGVICIWRRKPCGEGITLFGMGMFAYSAINSMGWTFINDPTQSIPMVITLIIVVAAIPILIPANRK